MRAATPTQSVEIAVPVKKDIEIMLENKKKYIKSLLDGKIEKSRKELKNLENSYALKNFSKIIDNYRNEIVLKEKNLDRAFKIFLERKRQELILKTEKVINLNPLGVLARGYSITKKDEKIIKNSSEIKIGDEITTNLYSGTVISTVKEIK